MFLSSSPRRILAYREPVDMRKSFDGLIGVVQSVLSEDPLSGTLFVFFNHRGNYLKLIAWDRTGYCLFAKRLERGRFQLPSDETKQEGRDLSGSATYHAIERGDLIASDDLLRELEGIIARLPARRSWWERAGVVTKIF